MLFRSVEFFLSWHRLQIAWLLHVMSYHAQFLLREIVTRKSNFGVAVIGFGKGLFPPVCDREVGDEFGSLLNRVSERAVKHNKAQINHRTIALSQRAEIASLHVDEDEEEDEDEENVEEAETGCLEDDMDVDDLDRREERGGRGALGILKFE